MEMLTYWTHKWESNNQSAQRTPVACSTQTQEPESLGSHARPAPTCLDLCVSWTSSPSLRFVTCKPKILWPTSLGLVRWILSEIMFVTCPGQGLEPGTVSRHQPPNGPGSVGWGRKFPMTQWEVSGDLWNWKVAAANYFFEITLA